MRHKIFGQFILPIAIGTMKIFMVNSMWPKQKNEHMKINHFKQAEKRFGLKQKTPSHLRQDGVNIHLKKLLRCFSFCSFFLLYFFCFSNFSFFRTTAATTCFLNS